MLGTLLEIGESRVIEKIRQLESIADCFPVRLGDKRDGDPTVTGPVCPRRRIEDTRLAVGERVFGFFPMATHLVIDAEGAGPANAARASTTS